MYELAERPDQDLWDSIDYARADGFALTAVSPELAESTASDLATMMQSEHGPEMSFVTRNSLMPGMVRKRQPVEFPPGANLTGLVITGGSGLVEVVSGKTVDSTRLQAGSVMVFARSLSNTTWYKIINQKTLKATWVESASTAAYRADQFLVELEQGAYAREVTALRRIRNQELAQRRLNRLMRKIGQTANQ